jgi:peptidoglycan/xylan/chitin deacetylase (PgdA/CDA1 family)
MLKNQIKSILGLFLRLFYSKQLRNRITIFNYHDISVSPSEFSDRYGLNVLPKTFEFQINYLNRKFNFIGPDELAANKIPQNAALITFDDAFKDIFSTAIPILQKYGIPSIIFLNMDVVKGDVLWAGIITYLCDKDPKFLIFLKEKLGIAENERDMYLYCSKEIVDEYLATSNKDFNNEVLKFTGEFASFNDLRMVEKMKGIYLGNHLSNHFVAANMSNEELLESYLKNEKELNKFQNNCNMFAFPFGQPITCFLDEQVTLLTNAGAKKIFTTYGFTNSIKNNTYLHRIPLSANQNTSLKIWFKILYRKLPLQSKWFK